MIPSRLITLPRPNLSPKIKVEWFLCLMVGGVVKRLVGTHSKAVSGQFHVPAALLLRKETAVFLE